MYQKPWERECINLAWSTTASAASIHVDAITTSPHTHCNKCGCSRPHSKYLTYRQQCYACSSANHFTALCKQRRRQLPGKQTLHWSYYAPWRSQSKHWGCCSSCFLCRHCCQSPSHSTSHCPSCSPSHSPAYSASPQQSNQHHCHATPNQYSKDSIKVIPTDSIMTHNQPEGSLYQKCLWWLGCLLYQASVTHTWQNHTDDHQD